MAGEGRVSGTSEGLTGVTMSAGCNHVIPCSVLGCCRVTAEWTDRTHFRRLASSAGISGKMLGYADSVGDMDGAVTRAGGGGRMPRAGTLRSGDAAGGACENA